MVHDNNDKEEQELEQPNLFKKTETEEQIQHLLLRIIRLENKLKQHAKDEYAHTFEQRQYDG